MRRTASIRARTTVAAVVIVAVALLAGSLALVLLVRGSLHDGVETAAELRAEAVASQVEATGPDSVASSDDDPDPDNPDPDDPEDPDDDPDEVVVSVTPEGGRDVLAGVDAGETVEIAGGDAPYLVAREEATFGDVDYAVVVAASTEDVADSTAALVPPLALGVPLLLLVVGGTTWLVVGRALRPVERMRAEVDGIAADRLDRRLPEPPGRDELHRLALTMNRMLARLEESRARQQRFVSDASHELRSPLAAIRQTAEVAREHPGALPEGELADAVLEEGARMQRIVEQLLLLTRLDERAGGERSARGVEVDLDDLLHAEVPRLRRQGLTVDVDGVTPTRVDGDPVALAQVVRNLVDNAARHARSRVTLSLAGGPTGTELAVADDGAGVPEADRERVFERFVRLDEARSRDAGGSGLGLAIVRELVALRGGGTRVEDAPGGGARFVVTLPAATTDAS